MSLFYDPDIATDSYDRWLPHWRQSGCCYFVTFRLADALPRSTLRQLQEDRKTWKAHFGDTDIAELTQRDKQRYYENFHWRIQRWLDAGKGACHLAEPQAAKFVTDAFAYFEGDRYLLGRWVIASNHVHLLIIPLGGHELSKILHSLKSFTANQLNRKLGRKGAFWMDESFDHIVRSARHLADIEGYIDKHHGIKGGIWLSQQIQPNTQN